MSSLPAYAAPPPSRPGTNHPTVPGRSEHHDSPERLVIRDMTRSDIETVTAIETEAHPLDAWSTNAFHAAVGDPRSYLCRVADTSTALVVGYAVVSLATDQADLQNLTVHADWRRHGLGRRLLADILGEAVRHGAREAFLEVRHDNAPAIGLYTSYGFAVVGRRRDYYAPHVDGVLMRTSLHTSESGHPTNSRRP